MNWTTLFTCLASPEVPVISRRKQSLRHGPRGSVESGLQGPSEFTSSTLPWFTQFGPHWPLPFPKLAKVVLPPGLCTGCPCCLGSSFPRWSPQLPLLLIPRWTGPCSSFPCCTESFLHRPSAPLGMLLASCVSLVHTHKNASTRNYSRCSVPSTHGTEALHLTPCGDGEWTQP